MCGEAGWARGEVLGLFRAKRALWAWHPGRAAAVVERLGQGRRARAGGRGRTGSLIRGGLSDARKASNRRRLRRTEPSLRRPSRLGLFALAHATKKMRGAARPR